MFERVLIFETSGKVGQVAIASAPGVLATRLLPEARRHARDLVARCAELLAERQWQAREVTAVVVNIGPGSFTGLRVGIASAKALAYANGCPLFGVPAFDSIAIRIPPSAQALEIIADALQDHVYCQCFEIQEQRWHPREPIRIRPFAEWAAEVRAGSLIAGPGVGIYGDKLSPSWMIVEDVLSEPDCGSLLRAAQVNVDRYRASAWDVEPIYLRGSSAEEKRKQESQNTSPGA